MIDRKRFSFLFLILVVIAASGCRSGRGGDGGFGSETERWSRVQAELLREASRSLGVPVQIENISQFSEGGATLITAPAEGLERVPATELPRGVNLGVAYVNSPGQSFPAGAYALRVSAPDPRIGENQGVIHLINANGSRVAQMAARITVDSLTTTPFNPSRRVSTRLAGHCKSGRETCYCCPTNGWIVCTETLFVSPNFQVDQELRPVP